MRTKNKRGFTIVELVIVISVIAILAAVLIPTFSGVIESANRSAALQSVRNELTEMKITLAVNGIELPNGTVLESNGFYFLYSDGELTETTKPSSTATALDNCSVYFANTSVKVGYTEDTNAFYNQDKNKDKYVEIDFATLSNATIVIRNSSGKVVYNHTRSDSAGKAYFSMYTKINENGEYRTLEERYAAGDSTNIDSATRPSADYYYYTITSGTTTYTGVFYY